jgi:DNA repair protein RecO (recombination protein O)
MRYREPSICLRATDYSETSQVVHFLSRGQGLVGLLAKGSKRPKSKTGGRIDLLSEGELIFSGTSRESLGTLIEFSESALHSGLRKDSARLNTALFMIEMVGEMLATGDPHPEVFDLLQNALARLDQADSPVGAVLAYFQWRLLTHAGLLGEMDHCVACGGGTEETRHGQDAHATEIYFSSIQGGLLCRNCEAAVGEKYRVDAAALKGLAVLKAVTAGKRQALPEDQAKSVNRLLAYHISHQLGKRLRMARHAI